jgi:hypothetical protein
VLADVVDGADIRMIQRGRSLGFTLKAAERLRILRKFLRKEFESDPVALENFIRL